MSGDGGLQALEATGLSVSFGGVQAVDDVTLRIETGHVTGLVGPNGAGKSTVLNLLSGYYKPDRGGLEWVNDGSRERLPDGVDERARVGLGRTFQTPRLIRQLTVWENVAIGGAWSGGWPTVSEIVRPFHWSRHHAERRRLADELLATFGLAHKADATSGELSLGEQRLVEIARAVFKGCRVLLLDEPFAGLSSSEKNRLKHEVRTLADAGVGILLVEHNLEVVRALSTDVVVLHQGAVLKRGDAPTALADPRVVEVFLGPEELVAEHE